MIRRSVLAAGAVLAALAISSCSTVTRSDAVAEVNGVKLTRAELMLLTGNSTDGGVARAEITAWLKVGGLGGDLTKLTGGDDLAARGAKLREAIVPTLKDEAKQQYAKGLDGSPALCLAAIPLAATTNPDTVLAALAAGTTFADAAKQYSSDATFAQSGGVIKDQSGAACLDPAGFNADILASMKKAGAAPGKAVAIDLNNSKVIIELRPFEDLAAADWVPFVQSGIDAAATQKLASLDVYVNSQYGTWDPTTGTVIPLAQS